VTRVGVENKAQESATVKDRRNQKGTHNATDINIMDGSSLRDPRVESATGSSTNACTVEEKSRAENPAANSAVQTRQRKQQEAIKKRMCRSGSMQNEEQTPVCRLIQSKNAVPGRKCNHAD